MYVLIFIFNRIYKIHNLFPSLFGIFSEMSDPLEPIGGFLHRNANLEFWETAYLMVKDSHPNPLYDHTMEHLRRGAIDVRQYFDAYKLRSIKRIKKKQGSFKDFLGFPMKPSATALTNVSIMDKMILDAQDQNIIFHRGKINEIDYSELMFGSIHLSLDRPSKPRLVYDAVPQNSFFRKNLFPCEYEDLYSLNTNFSAKSNIKADDKVTFLDLRGFYNQFRVCDKSSNYLCFTWRNEVYVECFKKFIIFCGNKLFYFKHLFSLTQSSRSDLQVLQPRHKHAIIWQPKLLQNS